MRLWLVGNPISFLGAASALLDQRVLCAYAPADSSWRLKYPFSRYKGLLLGLEHSSQKAAPKHRTLHSRVHRRQTVSALSDSGDVSHGVVCSSHLNNSLQALGCRDDLGPPFLAEAMVEGYELLGCRRCKLVGELCYQVRGATRGSLGMAQHQKWQETDWLDIIQDPAASRLQPQAVPKKVTGRARAYPDTHDGKGWKHQDRRSHSTCRCTGQWQIWFSALLADVGLGDVSSEMSEPATPEPCSSTTF